VTKTLLVDAIASTIGEGRGTGTMSGMIGRVAQPVDILPKFFKTEMGD
jgi:hypothetical protein